MAPTTLTEGALIAGRYRLDRFLGEGGMGRVWAATHAVTRRAVAIKFLKEGIQHKPDVRQRFLREASAASALRHPNVVEVIDVFDLEDASPVMVMELLEGETLGAKLTREERLSTEETAALLIPVISAVELAHSLGIVHRDLKPENIFICRAAGTGRVKVLDFGIAKLSAEHYLELGQSVLQTEAGAILGTPCYMAPEQLTSSGVDHLADTWSLGVILYECLSGTRPVEGRNLAEVIARLMSGAITPLERLAPELPHDVTAVVQQMLSRDLKRRPQDLGEVTKVLTRYSHVRPVVAPLPTVASVPDRGHDEAPHSVKPRKQGTPNRTMQSAPALGLDTAAVDSTDPSSSSPSPPAKPRRTRSILYAVAAGAAVALLLVVLNVVRQSAPPAPPVNELTAAAARAAPLIETPEPSATAAGPSPASAASADRAPAPSARPLHIPTAPTSHAARPPPPAKNDSPEGVLFSGRK